jgi:NAD(P)-dependent dehydrogenase (short-subunit alcohol dehydrogenase family)
MRFRDWKGIGALFDHFNGMGSSIHPVVVDVTNNEQVQSCSQVVKKWLDDDSNSEKRYLHALVNNAGVGVVGYVDWLDLSDFECCMNGEFGGPTMANIQSILPVPDTVTDPFIVSKQSQLFWGHPNDQSVPSNTQKASYFR